MRIRASYFAAARFIAVSISATLVFILAHNNTAHAVPITYDFTATAAGGPLNGDVFSGTLSADSTVVAAGNGNVTLVSFDLLGTVFTQSEGVFGLVPSATFNAAGDLTSLANFVVISNARAADLGIGGGVFIPSPVTSFNFDGNFNYGTDPTQGENFGLGGGERRTCHARRARAGQPGSSRRWPAGVRRDAASPQPRVKASDVHWPGLDAMPAPPGAGSSRSLLLAVVSLITTWREMVTARAIDEIIGTCARSGRE